jgi:hypothetical protein
VNEAQHRIVAEVIGERERQDAQWGGPEHDDRHLANDWVAIIVRHLGLAADDAAATDPERFRRQLVRVAAVAVAALESFDRTRRPKAAGHVPEEWRSGA